MLITIVIGISVMLNVIFASIAITAYLYGCELAMTRERVTFVWNGWANRNRTNSKR